MNIRWKKLPTSISEVSLTLMHGCVHTYVSQKEGPSEKETTVNRVDQQGSNQKRISDFLFTL